MDESTLEKAVYGIVIIIVLFYVYAALVPTGQTAGDTINHTGYTWNGSEWLRTGNTIPLASLFSSTGVVWVVVMGALIVVIVRYLLTHKK